MRHEYMSNTKPLRPKVIIAVVGILWLGSLSSVKAAHMVGLGQFPDGSHNYSHDISDDASVVVGGANSKPNPATSREEAYMWTASTGLVGLGVPGSEEFCNAWAVSGDGSTVVGEDDHVDGPWYWTETSGIVPLQQPNVSDFTACRVNDANYDGTRFCGTVYTGTYDGPRYGYTWDAAGNATPLDYLSYASGISADGSTVVGSYFTGSNWEYDWSNQCPAIETADSLILLDALGTGEATCCSSDGSIVFGDAGDGLFRWTQDDGMISLGTFGGAQNFFVEDCAPDGSAAVGFYHLSGDSRPWIWTEDGGLQQMQYFLADQGVDTTGWVNIERGSAFGVTKVDDTLYVLGNALVGPSGHSEPYLVTVPEPGTAILLSIGAMGLWQRRRRR